MPATDVLSETKACDLLARLFRARGYAVTRNIPFREYGVSFHIDGWDAMARVGFEFLTSEDEDHDDLTLEEYKTLMAAQQRGELSLFVIDEVEPLSASDLKATVEEFLDEVTEATASRRTTGKPAKADRAVTKKAAGKPAAKKTGAKKTRAKKTVAKKTATKKTVAKKTATKKTVAKKPAAQSERRATKVAARTPVKPRPGTSSGRKKTRRR
ncbi:MAG: hypothetical protein FJ284_08220 [Planctomycetes bacterium]|nr:hypothetical protein [Planctomycetota bacterium]